MNFSSPLEPELRAGLFGGVPGHVQIDPRSELLAAVRTLDLTDPDPVVLFSDSAYFVDGIADDREHAFASGNGDFWQRYWHAVDLHLGCVLARSVFKISCLLLRPKPWQFEICDSTGAYVSNILVFNLRFETLNLTF